MDRKLMVVSVVAIVALVVAAVALAEAYTVISEYNAKNLASPTFNPMQTAAPASSPSISSQPSATAAATSSINGTEPLSSTLSVSSIYGINTTQTISSGTIYQFTVSINNPNPSPQPSYPCNLQFVLNEEYGERTALPSDAVLGVYTVSTAGGYYGNVTAAANGDSLTYVWAPSGYYSPGIGGFSQDGFTVTSCFNETFDMQIVFNVSGTFSLGVNVVPAA